MSKLNCTFLNGFGVFISFLYSFIAHPTRTHYVFRADEKIRKKDKPESH